MNVTTFPDLQKVVEQATTVARERSERLIVLKLPAGEMLQLINRAGDELSRRIGEYQSSGLNLIESHDKVNYEGHRSYRAAREQFLNNQRGASYLKSKHEMEKAIEKLKEAQDGTDA